LHGPGVVKDCEGGLIKNIEAFPTLAVADAMTVDKALAQLLQYQADSDGRALRRELQSYFRQYVGVRANGRDLVYVAGYNAIFMPAMSGEIDYRARPLGVVCDGGTLFFRAAFDIEAGKFVKFAFGGPVWSCCIRLHTGALRLCDAAILCRDAGPNL
jgi:hypothetical protein